MIPARTRAITALALAAAITASAHAQVPSQHFEPVPGGDHTYLTVEGTSVLPALKPSGGLMVDYALNPLVTKRPATGEEVSQIAHQLYAHVMGAIGLFDLLEVGLVVPFSLFQAEGDPSTTITPLEVSSFAIGDIRLVPKVRILDHEGDGFGLAFALPLYLPTGSDGDFAGSGGFSVEPRLLAELALSESFRLATRIGFRLQKNSTHVNIQVGNQLTAALAAEYTPLPGTLALLAEMDARFVVDGDFSSAGEERPMEARLAGRWSPQTDGPHAVTFGLGRGIGPGYGAPDLRVFASYSFTARTLPDDDGDGVPDSRDRCPSMPEDLDGHEDDDGCPELDNDGDGLPDGIDKCPNAAEDEDGDADTDGCPEDDPAPEPEPEPEPAPAPNLDADGDGILDHLDKCPGENEDFDGFEDEDGCPDPDPEPDPEPSLDADGDGVLDHLDKCPDEDEDFDGFEDEDGCPDPDPEPAPAPAPQPKPAPNLDADGDGVLDHLDKCPGEAEDVDGFEDGDGCPDLDNDGDGILDHLDNCPGDPQNACKIVRTECAIVIGERIEFTPGSTLLKPDSTDILMALADAVRTSSHVELFEIQGHTDDKGPEETNLRLSQKRAESVMRFLLSQGVQNKLLLAKGYGESRPLGDNKTKEGRTLNRRVEIIILKPEPKGDCRRERGEPVPPPAPAPDPAKK